MQRLASEFGVTVFIEPGTALVQQAGMLVSEVLDVFESGSRHIALIDASTSHMPEVFEYEFTPTLAGLDEGSNCNTILGSKSCLAGDVFGEYSTLEPIRVGDRVAIMDAGSYSQARAAPFNGIPIPPAIFCERTVGSKCWQPTGTRNLQLVMGWSAVRLLERAATISPRHLDFGAIESEITSALDKSETAVRFAVTKSGRGGWECELA